METKYFDRISEGYKGELGTEVMEQARKRIDWICAKSQGCLLYTSPSPRD